jgi:hypothetical protein
MPSPGLVTNGVRVCRVSGARVAEEALTEGPRSAVVVIMEVEADSMVEAVEVVTGKDFYFAKTGVAASNNS